jgi:catechol 2,3-dioxygenase-like lactoylglutathione lyase family enzyme
MMVARVGARGEKTMSIEIERLDHLVLTVADLERTVAFYRDVLGMRPMTFGDGRRALGFGPHKINLHQAGHEFEPKARRPIPGSADICLIAVSPLLDVTERLAALGVAVEDGPVARTGALGPMMSVYLRDPDGNLLEISRYDDVPS